MLEGSYTAQAKEEGAIRSKTLHRRSTMPFVLDDTICNCSRTEKNKV